MQARARAARARPPASARPCKTDSGPVLCRRAALQGGEFIVRIKESTKAKVTVDKPVRDYEERVIHVESADT